MIQYSESHKKIGGKEIIFFMSIYFLNCQPPPERTFVIKERDVIVDSKLPDMDKNSTESKQKVSSLQRFIALFHSGPSFTKIVAEYLIWFKFHVTNILWVKQTNYRFNLLAHFRQNTKMDYDHGLGFPPLRALRQFRTSTFAGYCWPISSRELAALLLRPYLPSYKHTTSRLR